MSEPVSKPDENVWTEAHRALDTAKRDRNLFRKAAPEHGGPVAPRGGNGAGRWNR